MSVSTPFDTAAQFLAWLANRRPTEMGEVENPAACFEAVVQAARSVAATETI